MGSYDPILSAFTPTEYLGSSDGNCATDFDQLAFIAGASSNLFNEFNITVRSFHRDYLYQLMIGYLQAEILAESSIGPLIEAINATFPQPGIRLDSAAIPNPFFGIAPDTFIDSNQTIISLVDGGDDGEVSPLQPMLVKARAVDVIFVIDAVSTARY